MGVVPIGFEPIQTASKTVVLPLHYGTVLLLLSQAIVTRVKIKQIINNKYETIKVNGLF